MSDDDLDLLDGDDTAAKQAAEAEAAKAAAAKAKADAEAAATKEASKAQADAAEAVAASLVAVRDAWAEHIRGEFPMADFQNIGIAGLDEAAKEKFKADAQASQAAREEEFKKLGLVYDPARAAEGAADSNDAVIAAQWGSPVAGATGANSDEELAKAIQDATAAGDVQGVAKLLLGPGRLAKFIKTGKRD